MANTNAPSGFKPIRHLSGGEIRYNEYTIASGYNTSIFYGEPVNLTGTGKNIAVSSAGTATIGCFYGVSYTDATGKEKFSRYWPANTVATNIKANVADDPNIIYHVQCGTLADTNVGSQCNHVVGAGNTSTGTSGGYLDGSYATTGKYFRVLGIYPDVSNDYGAYAKAEVTIIKHELRGGS